MIQSVMEKFMKDMDENRRLTLGDIREAQAVLHQTTQAAQAAAAQATAQAAVAAAAAQAAAQAAEVAPQALPAALPGLPGLPAAVHQMVQLGGAEPEEVRTYKLRLLQQFMFFDAVKYI
jgi:type V secretory pathway adhesin AidA